MEGSGSGLIKNNVLAFAWRYRKKRTK